MKVSPLTYAEASNGLSELLSPLGFALKMGEAEVKPTVKALRKQVSAYYASLNRENRLDVLHAYDASSKAELIENALTEMFERVGG
jgi:hypothetical protein